MEAWLGMVGGAILAAVGLLILMPVIAYLWESLVVSWHPNDLEGGKVSALLRRHRVN